MGNYIEYGDRIIFHPGYYIKEILEESDYTKKDFAKRLNIAPEKLDMLINGKINLSNETVLKLSELTGTSINYWYNIQMAYDDFVFEMKSKNN